MAMVLIASVSQGSLVKGLIAGLLGMLAAMLAAHLLNRFRLSRFFFYPPLVLLALAVLFTVAIGTWIIPS